MTFDSSRRPAETEPHPRAARATHDLRPSLEEIRRSLRAATSGLPVFALADGYAYGISSDSGTPTWQVPVGLSSPFAPWRYPAGRLSWCSTPAMTMLVRLDARTGKLIWRQALGTPIQDPPLVLGNQVIQAAPDGNVYLLDLMSGGLPPPTDWVCP